MTQVFEYGVQEIRGCGFSVSPRDAVDLRCDHSVVAIYERCGVGQCRTNVFDNHIWDGSGDAVNPTGVCQHSDSACSDGFVDVVGTVMACSSYGSVEISGFDGFGVHRDPGDHLVEIPVSLWIIRGKVFDKRGEICI